MYERWYDEILSKLSEQGIDTSDCYLMFNRGSTYFNGGFIDGVTESKDGRFICIPVKDEDEIFGGYSYRPQCFEIKNKFTTYISDGMMSVLSTIWLLYK